MFEGKEIIIVHPSGERVKGIIAGCDEEKGVTVISAENPEKILYCNIGENEEKKEQLRWFIEAAREEREWDIVEELVKRKKIKEKTTAFYRFTGRIVGALQEELHNKCPFK